jgi:hypothetical protein
MKWLEILNAVGSVGVGISEQSFGVFCAGMLGAFFSWHSGLVVLLEFNA